MNVSSIVVKTKPEHHGEVQAALEAADFCDVHFNDGKGKIVVTVEGENIELLTLTHTQGLQARIMS